MKKSDNTPLANYISKENSDLTYICIISYKIVSLLIMFYIGVNKLVLPEYSFPAKAVVNMMASNLNIFLMIILLRIPIYNI